MIDLSINDMAYKFVLANGKHSVYFLFQPFLTRACIQIRIKKEGKQACMLYVVPYCAIKRYNRNMTFNLNVSKKKMYFFKNFGRIKIRCLNAYGA